MLYKYLNVVDNLDKFLVTFINYVGTKFYCPIIRGNFLRSIQ